MRHTRFLVSGAAIALLPLTFLAAAPADAPMVPSASVHEAEVAITNPIADELYRLETAKAVQVARAAALAEASEKASVAEAARAKAASDARAAEEAATAAAARQAPRRQASAPASSSRRQAAPAAAPRRAGGSTPPEYVKQCESGGNYQAVNPNGHYGAWQFSQATWNGVGGTGRPDQASPAEQDHRAAILWNNGAGAGNWACA
jgi:hypothetical protein